MKSPMSPDLRRTLSFIDAPKLPAGTEIVQQTVAEAEETVDFLWHISREKGWQPPEGALEAYPERSVFLVHRDRHSILGALKLVCSCPDEALPVTQVWPEFELGGRRNVAELSVLALNPSARGRHAFLPLTAEVWRYCMSRGINELWAELEPRMLSIYRRFGWPFEVMGQLREYWGDPLYPCRLFGEDWLEEHLLRARKSPRYLSTLEQAVSKTDYQQDALERLYPLRSPA